MEKTEIIMGIVFDFAAFLTTLGDDIVIGKNHPPDRLIMSCVEWGKSEGINDCTPNVMNWENFFRSPIQFEIGGRVFKEVLSRDCEVIGCIALDNTGFETCNICECGACPVGRERAVNKNDAMKTVNKEM